LNSKPELLNLLRDSRRRVDHKTKLDTEAYKNKATSSDISFWIDNKSGMVIENLTHRAGEFRELKDNIVAIESYLNSKPEILKSLRDSRSHLSDHPQGKGNKFKSEFENKATASDISFWIDNKSEFNLNDIYKTLFI